MYARHLAVCCLLPLSIASGSSLPDASKDVVVYLKPAPGLSASAVDEAKTELASVMRAAGVNIAWWDPGRSSVLGTLVVADFIGMCSVPAAPAEVADIGSLPPLAHTSTADGRILPLTYVDCGTLSQVTGPALVHLPMIQREHMYGRAIGRLLAHEIYHILAQTRDHAASGIAKMHFSAADLLGTHFDFEPATTAHMWGKSAPSQAGRAFVGF